MGLHRTIGLEEFLCSICFAVQSSKVGLETLPRSQEGLTTMSVYRSHTVRIPFVYRVRPTNRRPSFIGTSALQYFISALWGHSGGHGTQGHRGWLVRPGLAWSVLHASLIERIARDPIGATVQRRPIARLSLLWAKHGIYCGSLPRLLTPPAVVLLLYCAYAAPISKGSIGI